MEVTNSAEGSSNNTTIATVNTEIVHNPVQESSVKLKVSNLHRLVDADELRKFFEESHGSVIVGAKVHYYGPKSTGNGYVEVKSMPEAIEIVKKMNSAQLREQPITVTLPNLNHEVRKIKREKHRQVKKVVLPYQQELNQVKNKYPSFSYDSETPPVSFSLQLKPSDPEFPFDLAHLDIKLELPETYPEEPCIITEIKNDDIPSRVKNQIINSWKSRAQIAYKNKPMLIGLLRWLDNNMEKLLIDQIATQDFELAKQGIQIIVNPRQNLKITTTTTPSPTVVPTSDTPPVQPPADPIKVPQEPPKNYATATEHRGTQILLENLKIENIGILECVSLKIVLLCQRCRLQLEVNLTPNVTFAVECEKCHNAIIATFRKDAMHEASSVLGYLDISNTIPFDILSGTSFNSTCLECSANVPWKQIPITGMDYSQNCENCHKKLSVSIERARFVKIKAERPPPDVVVIKKKKVKDPALAGIRVGSPLPDEGTCKHYRKSTRWFRFPCCGRVFPCDICHEENNKDSHEMMLANRMLCGFCSREQPISDKPCVCGALLNGTRRTQFWEGGKGMRDNSKLSKNDSKKYAGMSKTQSMKDTRVGPKKN